MRHTNEKLLAEVIILMREVRRRATLVNYSFWSTNPTKIAWIIIIEYNRHLNLSSNKRVGSSLKNSSSGTFLGRLSKWFCKIHLEDTKCLRLVASSWRRHSLLQNSSGREKERYKPVTIDEPPCIHWLRLTVAASSNETAAESANRTRSSVSKGRFRPLNTNWAISSMLDKLSSQCGIMEWRSSMWFYKRRYKWFSRLKQITRVDYVQTSNALLLIAHPLVLKNLRVLHSRSNPLAFNLTAAGWCDFYLTPLAFYEYLVHLVFVG
jgi:hypothetical protein